MGLGGGAPRLHAEVFEAPRHRRPRGAMTVFYAEVALRRPSRRADRGERAPVRAKITDELGDGSSREAVRDILSRARAHRLLSIAGSRADGR